MTIPTVEFTVKATEGGEAVFESKLSGKLNPDPEQNRELAAKWMSLMLAGLAFAKDKP